MKLPAATFAVALALLSFGCGGNDDSSAAGETEATAPVSKNDPRLPALADSDDPHFATVTFSDGRGEPVVELSDLPTPNKLLVRDLRVGSGPVVALPGDQLSVRYVGVDRTGKVQFHGWLYPSYLQFRLGDSGNGEGFEKGVAGMREGGIRELIIPSRLTYGGGPPNYVVELVRLEPASKSSSEG